ncbi:DUF4124 domain-containing protein [Polaromonas sp.]|jgi:hypothetical protein|uniref:DUF4124 domain-containing protein n=2 Tax=unclassified Polaromonas TaxID=2638319 RepID=UPI0026C88362|nr:DUF4124 domain-containing protein [Polaromonas sp.]
MQMHVQTMTALAWVALGACLCSIAQAQGIYSCVDGKGRKITADRPIAECIDRPQREINPSGTVKRVVGPSLTAQERAAQEQKDKAAAEVRAREAEEKRRDRALLLRYPSRAVHDKERAEALDQIDVVIKAASKRTTELAGQRKAIDADFEFYKSDPAKAPASLKRRLEENDSSVAVQKRFIADQDAEKKRVNMRFDEELVKLNQLWAMGGAVPAAAAAPTGRK